MTKDQREAQDCPITLMTDSTVHWATAHQRRNPSS
jgi:hypothetical protein